MAFVPPRDRVAETSTSNSQSVFALAGALDTSFNAFSASMSVGDTTIGGVVESGVAFKSGILTYSATNEITVSTVKESKGTFSSGGTKHVFMGLPGLVALMVDGAQALTSAQKAQGRANLDVLKKNYVVNGAMMVSQENGTTAGTTTGYYPVDQFFASFSNAGAISTAQVASVSPCGSPNRLRFSCTTADASVAAGDYAYVATRLEGLRVADLRLGSASAKAAILQFGVKAPAGTYCVVLINSANNRSYVGEYVISGGEANTDVVKTVSLNLDTSGTWLTSTGIGLEIRWGLMAGSTYQQAAGSWSTGNVVGSSNQFNFMGSNTNVFELFDVGLYEGSAAPAFQVPDYPAELLLCQRYFSALKTPSTSGQALLTGMVYTSTFTLFPWLFPVPMRATPSMSASNYAHFQVRYPSGAAVGTATITYTPAANSTRIEVTTAAVLTAGQAALLEGAGATPGAIYANSRL